MRKLRIYIDTSVVGGVFDDEFKEESKRLFEMASEGSFVILISDILIDELREAPKDVNEYISNISTEVIEPVFSNKETAKLRDAYINAKVLGKASISDAHHVALATVYNADMILSWNFKHIVHYDKMRLFNAVNILNGYNGISIYSPPEVIT